MKKALIAFLVVAILICVIILAFPLFSNNDNATTENDDIQETTPEEATVNTSGNEATTPEQENSQTTIDEELTGETTEPEPAPSLDETTNTTPDVGEKDPEGTSGNEDASTTPGGAAPIIPPDDSDPPQLTEDSILMLSNEVQNTDMFIGIGVYVDKSGNVPYVAGQRIQGVPHTNLTGATDYYFDQFHSVCVMGGWDLYESKISSTTNMVYTDLGSTSLSGGGNGLLLEGKYIDVDSKNKEVHFGLIYEGEQGPYLVVSGSSILTDELCVGFASASINNERVDCMISVTSYTGDIFADSIEVTSFIQDADQHGFLTETSSTTLSMSEIAFAEVNDFSNLLEQDATFYNVSFMSGETRIDGFGIEASDRGRGIVFERYILGLDGIAYKVYFTLG